MEEDLDFAAAAAKVFEHYKIYKQTSDAERGVCERCACPVAIKNAAGAESRDSAASILADQAQVPIPSHLCLCGYDNLAVRSDVRSAEHVGLRACRGEGA